MEKKLKFTHISIDLHLLPQNLSALIIKEPNYSHLLHRNKEFSKIHFLTHTIPAQSNMLS
jgi:hypothetical protein